MIGKIQKKNFSRAFDKVGKKLGCVISSGAINAKIAANKPSDMGDRPKRLSIENRPQRIGIVLKSFQRSR